MDFTTTRVYEDNARAWLSRQHGIRRALNEGGTSSTKTYSIMQLLILIAANAKRPFLISVVSESIPHLKRGCIRDFKNLMGPDFDDKKWNATDFIYTWKPGAMEFFSADYPAKLRGGRRKILFINECNNISYEGFNELDVRTEAFTFLDWNPVSEFWAHEHLLEKAADGSWRGRPGNQYIHSTYLDGKVAGVIPPEVIANIEARKDTDPNWWNIYGLGNVGRVEGLVYPFFEQCDVLPDGDYFYGLDFGFSGDPAVLVKNVINKVTLPDEKVEERLYSQELFYLNNLTNQDIGEKLTVLGLRKNYDEIFADAAEPKSIEELHRLGWNVKGAVKGEGSVEYGHQKVRQFKQYWTKDSLFCIKEQRNFRYIPDKDGKFTEKTLHLYSHGMDARRYGVIGKVGTVDTYKNWSEFLKLKQEAKDGDNLHSPPNK